MEPILGTYPQKIPSKISLQEYIDDIDFRFHKNNFDEKQAISYFKNIRPFIRTLSTEKGITNFFRKFKSSYRKENRIREYFTVLELFKDIHEIESVFQVKLLMINRLKGELNV